MIDEFKPGQDVYLLVEMEEPKTGDKIYQTYRRTVQDVMEKSGARRISLGQFLPVSFRKPGVRKMILFYTEEQVTDYIEKEMLKIWLLRNAGPGKINTYSLEQLRDVRKILEGNRTQEKEAGQT